MYKNLRGNIYTKLILLIPQRHIYRYNFQLENTKYTNKLTNKF